MRQLHREMLAATFGNGVAGGDVDLALHDLVGKALGYRRISCTAALCVRV